jgi:hypothetical protein
MTVDDLNRHVTDAILDAEAAEAGSASPRVVAHKYLAVSEVEQQLAALLSPATRQGSNARRGVVRAALRARAWDRALYWAGVYAKEQGAPDHLVADLDELAREAERAIEALQGPAPPVVARAPVVDISAAA